MKTQKRTLAFFRFWKFIIIKKDVDKEFADLVLDSINYAVIGITPLLLWIFTSVSLALFGAPFVLVTISIVVYLFFFIGNFIFLDTVVSEAREFVWREQRRKEREERARRFEENMEKLRRERREREKRRQERYQRMFDDYYKRTNRVDRNMQNAMKLLGLEEGFTKDDVRKAYRRLSKTHHPDMGGLEENFKKLKKAHDYIMKRM